MNQTVNHTLRRTTFAIISVLGLSLIAGIGIGLAQLESIILIGLAGAIGSVLLLLLMKPELGVYLLVATIYVVLLPGTLSATSIAGLGDLRAQTLLKDALLLVLVLAWLLRLLFGKVKPKSDTLTFVVIGFIAWAVIRGITSPLGYVIGLAGTRTTVAYAFLFFVVGTTIRSEKHLYVLLWLLVLTSLYPIITGLLQTRSLFALSPMEAAALQGVSAEGRFGAYRIYSLSLGASNSANIFAGYVGVVLATVLALRIFDDGRLTVLKRTFLTGYSMTLGLVLILTFSRRVWVAFIFVFLLYLILRQVRIGTTLTIILTTTAAILILPETILDLAGSRLSVPFLGYHYTGLQTRLSEWEFLWKQVTQNPLLLLIGAGLGMAGPIAVVLNIATGISGHNYYLLILYQLGIIGFVLFLIILIGSVTKMWRGLRGTNNPVMQQALAAALATTIIVAISALIGVSFENYPLNLMYWLFLGIAQAAEQVMQNKEVQKDTTPQFPQTGMRAQAQR